MIGSDARRRVSAAVLGAVLGLVAVPAGHAQSEFANRPCTLRLIVVLISPSRDVFYGTADMPLLRRAIVVDTGQFVRSEVWRMAYVLHGAPGGAKGQLLGLVDEMLTRFAADYRRSGNS